jgi:hypothetical protein
MNLEAQNDQLERMLSVIELAVVYANRQWRSVHLSHRRLRHTPPSYNQDGKSAGNDAECWTLEPALLLLSERLEQVAGGL